MLQHDLIQGSPEWNAYRAQHFNASDAPSMMGCSPYKTRTELLHERHTGLTADVDASTQRRFDDGHRYEALARPLAAAIIGEALFPVTGSEGKLSASFDGLTMDESIAFEHKSLNDELRGLMPAPEMVDHEPCNAIIPKHYRIQMQQQCMVSGANRVLFMATKWDGDNLVESRHCWYESDPDLAAEITAGWAQFEADLAAYVPAEVVEKAVPKVASSLPVVFDMRVEGKLVSCNLEAYKPAALAYIAAINSDLTTDQQFADAATDAAYCRDSADKLELAIELALGQMGDINAALNTVREIAATFDAKGLALEKLVDKRKAEIKEAAIVKAKAATTAHAAGLEAEIAPIKLTLPAADFVTAAKNKRTVASLQDALDTALATWKIAADTQAKDLRAKLAWFKVEAADHQALFADLQAVIQKQFEDFQLVVKTRVYAQKAKDQQIKDDAAAAALKAAEPVAPAPAPAAAPAPAPVANVVSMGGARRPAPTPATPPSLKLGQIGERLGFALTAEFLKTLGFEPAARDKSALLFHESSFTLICAALVSHINQVQAKQAA
ncbi:MAG: YqaJ viral recombinase family protein [Pseudomonadota bacterium]